MEAVDKAHHVSFLVPGLEVTVDENRIVRQQVVVCNNIRQIHHSFVPLVGGEPCLGWWIWIVVVVTVELPHAIGINVGRVTGNYGATTCY